MSDPDLDREKFIDEVDSGDRCPGCYDTLAIRHWDTVVGRLHECGCCGKVWFDWGTR